MITDYQIAVENIRKQLRQYLQNSGLKSLVLGQSGGIDSALSTVLATPVCQELDVELISRSITIITNKPDEIERAADIGKYFSTDFAPIDLTDSFEGIATAMTEDYTIADRNQHAFKIRMGNIKARMRMIYLYDLASKHQGMVLSTDNYTELLLGFWTLHGDVGDYGMIQNLWKTEVYAMARYLASEMENPDHANALLACVSAVATDGLGITNSDLDQIQASSYEEVDQLLIQMLKNPDKLGELANHPVIQRKNNSEFKRNNPYNIPRNEITLAPLF